MLAIIKEKPGEGYLVTNTSMPEVNSNDVLIKVKAVGICGTDIPIFDGIRQVPIPLIPGHEFSGVVEQVGSNVTKFNIGDRVTAGLVINCGECIYCKQGLESLCENITETGIHVNGAFAEYVSVPEKTLHILPDDITFELGASIDPIASAYRPVKKVGISSEDTVIIFGPGPIGIYTMQCAKVEGARKIIVVGVNGDEERLALAKKLGADYTINLNEQDLIKSIRKINNGILPDIAIEASGHSSAVQMCLDVVRTSGRIVFVGIQHEKVELDVSKIVRQEIKIQGSICYTWTDFHHCIDLVTSKRIKVEPLITHKFQLKDIEKGLIAVKNKEAMKVMLYP